MPLYFSPHRGRHDHVREVVQEIDTPELIQMNDRTRIAHDMQSRLSRLHEAPLDVLLMKASVNSEAWDSRKRRTASAKQV